MTTAVVEVGSIVGRTFVREAEATDAIDGVTPKLVVSPAAVEEVSHVLAVAAREGWCVAPRGGGTKLGWGNPPSQVDLIVDVGRLHRVIEHAAGDLIVVAEAGVEVHALQSRLAEAGQMLALDVPGPRATLGGTIAANSSGPRRLRYGTARDLLIGVTVVLADGTIARAGGKVVKNVAGYDLSKLMTGSLGTLGIVTRATFRLHPLPSARRLVVADVRTAEGIKSAGQRLLHSTLVPTAIELAWPATKGAQIGVLFEGVEPSVAAQAARAADLLGPDAAGILQPMDGLEDEWREFTTSLDPSPGLVELKVSCLPADLGTVLTTIRRSAARHGVAPHLTGSLGNGILYLAFDDVDCDRAQAVVRDLRSGIRPGTVVLRRGPLELKGQVDAWGPVGDALGLMRRVKNRFDPGHVLNPGRFVGGI